MACPNKNRHRPKTVAFRVTEEEDLRIVQRVKITGEVKGDYLRSMALNGEINISVGKFKSDKLALAMKNLNRDLQRVIGENSEDDLKRLLDEIQIMLKEIYPLVMPEKVEII